MLLFKKYVFLFDVVVEVADADDTLAEKLTAQIIKNVQVPESSKSILLPLGYRFFV